MQRKIVMTIPVVIGMLFAFAGCQQPADLPFSFQDSFNRPDDIALGNGWTAYAAADGSAVTLENHAAVLYGAAGNAAGIYRAFDRFTGDFELSVRVILTGSALQLWMVHDTGELYLAEFSLTGVDLRRENTILQSLAYTANANRLYDVVFRKVGSTLMLRAVEVSDPSVEVMIQATDATYDSFTGLQLWAGGSNNTAWITYVSLVNE
jgi:hypothetical protein